MRALPASLLVAVFLASLAGAGCFGSGGKGGDGAPATTAPPLTLPDSCDQPLFGGVRSREVDVTVDPNDRSRVAAVAMATPPSYSDLPGEGDIADWNSLARSSDGGLTWQTALLPYWPGDPSGVDPEYAGAVGFGDPIVSFAPNGDLYLSGIILTGALQYNMVALRFPGDSLTADTQTVFSRGGYGSQQLNMVPGFNPIAYNDKNDQVVDPVTGDWYVSWMWRSNANAGGISTVPVVVKSSDAGKTWEGPVMLYDSLLAGVTQDQANLAPAPFILGDKVYVVWSQPGTDDLVIASAPRGTLQFGPPAAFATMGSGASTTANVLTLPMVNVATGPGPGGVGTRAYVTVIRSGDGYDVGLWWTDDGATWTGPITPYATTKGSQLLPTVAVAPDGRVAVQYVDFSADAGDTHFVPVMSVSADGGLTWTETVLASAPTDTAAAGDVLQGHVGDYFGNAFTSAGLLGAWQDGRDGQPNDKFSEIYTCVLRPA